MKTYKKFYLICGSALLISACVGLGFFFGIHSWDQKLYVQVQDAKTRSLAGATKETALYSVSLKDIQQKIKTQLFENTKTIQEGPLLGLYIGNFLIPNSEKGGHQFVCDVYSNLEMTFIALDITFNGEEGSMVMQSPCLMADEQFIGPAWLPFQNLKANHNQRSFALKDHQTFVHLYHISFHLVSKWLLTSVRFFNSPEEDGLILYYQPNTKPVFLLDFTQE